MESEPMWEKSPPPEKFSPEEDRTHDAVLSRTVSPTYHQRAIPAPRLPCDICFCPQGRSICCPLLLWILSMYFDHPLSFASPGCSIQGLSGSMLEGCWCLMFIKIVCLLNVPATCECISGTDLHRQFYVLPHWDRSCRSNFPSHPVIVYWHRADQSQRWPYNARRLAG